MMKHILAMFVLGVGAALLTDSWPHVFGICFLGIALFLKMEDVAEKK